MTAAGTRSSASAAAGEVVADAPGAGPGAGPDPDAPAPVRPGRRRWRMVGRRLPVTVPLLIFASLGVFALAAASPFDPLTTYLGSRYQNASDATRAAMTEAYGLNDSWLVAWWTWVTDIFRGDLGTSMLYRQSVGTVIADRLPWTILLSGTALVLAAVAAIVFGLLAGSRPGSILDRAVRGLGMIVAAVPPFVFALAGVAVFAVAMHVAPVGGISELLVLGRSYEDGGGPLRSQMCAVHGGRPLLVEDLDLRDRARRADPGVLGGARTLASVFLLGVRPDEAHGRHETLLPGAGAISRVLAGHAHLTEEPVDRTWAWWVGLVGGRVR